MSTEHFARQSLDAEQTRKIFTVQREPTQTRLQVWSKSRNSIFLVLAAIFEAIVVIALEAIIYANFTAT
ncbi:hypothetical protein DFQ30_003802, partial [Apophysomyces sp. BC1015]